MDEIYLCAPPFIIVQAAVQTQEEEEHEHDEDHDRTFLRRVLNEED
jgi:hypothetical protein